MEVADRLIRDYDEVTTGSILRCLSRAVRQVRRSGCPLDKLLSQAETTARTMLDYRIDPSCERPAAPAPLPRPAEAALRASPPAGLRPPSSSPSLRRTG
jgi:hypothetical protein